MTESETTNPSRENIALADWSVMVLFGNSFQPCATNAFRWNSKAFFGSPGAT